MNAPIVVPSLFESGQLSQFNKVGNYFHQEYRATLDQFQVTVGLAISTEQLSQIYQLRETVYQDKMSYLLNDESDSPKSADLLDPLSYIFYCRQGDRVLASCRYTPSINGEWETPEITSLATQVPDAQSQLLQVGRLLIAPEVRSQMLCEILIWASCHWLEHNTPYSSFYAICSPALIRFYRHFGSKSIPRAELVLPERNNKTYRVVYGFVDTVKETLDRYITASGWHLQTPDENNIIDFCAHCFDHYQAI